jgi:hypothetical protein
MKTGIRAGEAYKNGYKRYKLEARGAKNKLNKLKRHCKKHPEDEQAARNLKLIEKNQKGEPAKFNPKNPGDLVRGPMVYFIHHPEQPKLPGEQLAKLLGLPFKRKQTKTRGKTSVKYKKKRNAKKVS